MALFTYNVGNSNQALIKETAKVILKLRLWLIMCSCENVLIKNISNLFATNTVRWCWTTHISQLIRYEDLSYTVKCAISVQIDFVSRCFWRSCHLQLISQYVSPTATLKHSLTYNTTYNNLILKSNLLPRKPHKSTRIPIFSFYLSIHVDALSSQYISVIYVPFVSYCSILCFPK